jgi:BirA family biotin operon repressor/biotin-[acetyl-CoA-carboxylase] ligase
MNTKDTKHQLLRLLADGCFHSGEVLACRLGVSRAAVWKHLRAIPDALGIEIDSVRGKGYRLKHGLELLDPQRIRAELASEQADKLHNIVIHGSIDSTNTWLMTQARSGTPGAIVCMAERQTAGRGRHGRQWVSPFGSNIYLSLLWRYPQAPAELGGLSLACGVAVARVLKKIGVSQPELKWPNDVLWKRRKLAGLLLEVGGEATGPSHVVVGVGINTRLPQCDAEQIDQPWIDLAHIPGVQTDSRNRIAALSISELVNAMDLYGSQGLRPFIADWASFDRFKGEAVELHIGPRQLRGDYLGIAEDGGIRLHVDGKVRSYNAGEVSLCRQSG